MKSKHFAIYAFLVLLYENLKGNRPEFTWNHFWSEVTFSDKDRYNWNLSAK